MWDWMEQNCNWKVDTYNANHDNSILELPFRNYSLKNTDYKSTIITFYFNIKDLKDSTTEVRPQSFYMNKGRETLKLAYPMVVFCDESTHEQIKSIREEYVPNPMMTKYIIKSITNYDFYNDNWDTIYENRKGMTCYKGSRNTASYYLVCMFKIIAIYIAKQHNFYNTEYYAWVDFGGSHIMRNFEPSAIKMLDNPNPKISFCYIHYRSHNELYPMNKLLDQGGYCGVGATSFTVQDEYVNRFYNGCLSFFHETLCNKLGHADEQIFTYFYDKYPELCHIYYGDYYSILENYHEPVEDYDCIVSFFLRNTVNKGRRDLGEQCAKKLYKCIKQKNIDWQVQNQTTEKNETQESSPPINHDLQNKLSYLDSFIPKNIVNKYVDKVIYINLESRKDRKAEIEGELDKFDIQYERFDAVSTPGFGILGCNKSHLEVLKMAREKKYKNILILEDDFTFIVSKEEFEKNIKLLFERPVDFDICMLSYNLRATEPIDDSLYPGYSSFLTKVLNVQTTSGYIINESKYDRLISLYEWANPLLESTKYHWVYALDQIWNTINSGTKWYCFNQRIGIQRPSFSDNSGKWCDLNGV